MHRLLSALAASLVLAACGGGGSSGPAPAPTAQILAATPLPCRVIGYGDSIMRGYYAEPTGQIKYLADPWSRAVERRVPGVTFEDRSVPGQNMRNVVEGFTHSDPQWGYVPAFNLQSRAGADVIVVESGVIDAWLTARDNLWSISETVDYYGRLDSIRRKVASEGAQLVITGLARQHVFPEGSPQHFITTGMVMERNNFDTTARHYATENAILFADIGAARFDGAADIVDTVHPTQAYSSRMAERLATTVKQACQNAGKL